MAVVKVTLCMFFFGACTFAQLMDKVNYTECKYKGSGELLEVRISNCAELPCLFKKGTRTTIEMDFIPSNDAVKVFTGAKARIGQKKLRFQGIDRTPACENISDLETGEDVEDCKLQAGKAYTYSYDLDILERYPTTTAQVQWKLSEGRHKTVVCFQLPVTIADA